MLENNVSPKKSLLFMEIKSEIKYLRCRTPITETKVIGYVLASIILLIELKDTPAELSLIESNDFTSAKIREKSFSSQYYYSYVNVVHSYCPSCTTIENR